MQTEVEAKFLDVSHDEVRKLLKALHAKLEHPMYLMKREMFDYPDSRFQKQHPHQRLRIRDEGNQTKITYKKNREDSDYVYEVETTVGSFEKATQILEAIGLIRYSFQESKRETWILDNTEVVLDEWPWLNPYIEIEGSNEDAIKKVAKKLGFYWKDAKFGSVDTAYMHQYPGMKAGDSIGDLPEVRFGMELPPYLRERT